MGIGETPITKQDSVSGASGPSKPAPSVDYSPNKLGEGSVKTTTDGKTQVTTSVGDSTGSRAGDDIARGARQSYFNQHGKWPPCINTDCRSYGRPHPNCLCFGPLSQAGKFEYAEGGEVCSSNHGHHDSCEHFADGGTITENKQIHNNPANTLSHVALHHGLIGVLTKTGKSKSENIHKATEDYIDHARRGHKSMHSHMENLFTTNKVEPDKKQREDLKKHLSDLNMHPEKMLEVGGNLNLPGHDAQLGALTGTAVNHFNAIKPKQAKTHPLDELTPVDKREESVFDRHLDLANNPALILQHVKDGMLLPSDIMTLRALYPSLHEKMKEKGFEALVGAKEKGVEIPYKMKQSLSLLMGQDLDSTMSQESMLAIIKSAGTQQAQNQQKNNPKPKKASGVELNQINKVNDMSATSLQERQMDKAKH